VADRPFASGRLSEVKEELRRLSIHALRRRVEILAEFRDALYAAHPYDEELENVTQALTPYTDAVLHALAKKEQGADYVPYPHPVGEWPFYNADR
jgi:hypothetical protein